MLCACKYYDPTASEDKRLDIVTLRPSIKQMQKIVTQILRVKKTLHNYDSMILLVPRWWKYTDSPQSFPQNYDQLKFNLIGYARRVLWRELKLLPGKRKPIFNLQ